MGIFAAAAILAGYYLLVAGTYKRLAFTLQLLGTLYYALAYLGTDFSIVIVNSVFFAISARGLWKEDPYFYNLRKTVKEKIDEYNRSYPEL